MIELTVSLVVLGVVGLFVSQGFYRLQNILAQNNMKQQAMLIVGNSLEQARVSGTKTAAPFQTILEREANASARPELKASCEKTATGLRFRVKTPRGRLIYELEMAP